jgi:hypothetical protein
LSVHERSFHIRSGKPFSEADLADVRAAVSRWRHDIIDVIRHVDGAGSISSYEVLDPILESDGSIVISLRGAPSYGVLKLLEDAFPMELVVGLNPEHFDNLEVGYTNQRMGISLSWRKLGAHERARLRGE